MRARDGAVRRRRGGALCDAGRWAAEFVFGARPYRALQWFRAGQAVVFALYLSHYLLDADEWLTDAGFHFAPEYALVPLLPPRLVPAFAAYLYAAAALVVLDVAPRVGCALLAAQAWYVLEVDRITAFTLNRFFVAWFAMLALAPAPQLVRGKWVVNGSMMRLFQAVILSQYFWCGVQKMYCGGTWLEHSDTLFSQFLGSYRTSFASLLLRTMPRWFYSAGMVATLVFELCAPLLFLLPWPYTWIPLSVGAVFHLFIAATFHMLIYFGAQIMLVYLFWMPDDFFERPVACTARLFVEAVLSTRDLFCVDVFARTAVDLGPREREPTYVFAEEHEGSSDGESDGESSSGSDSGGEDDGEDADVVWGESDRRAQAGGVKRRGRAAAARAGRERARSHDEADAMGKEKSQ